MLKQLLTLILSGQLKTLLVDPATEWHSLKVRYETPHVDRVWTALPDGSRLNLHRIYPCEEPLLHPHPWPSAVVVVDGSYQMEMGYQGVLVDHSVGTVLLTVGSAYEMLNPDGLHSVRPVGGPSLSIMLTGKPWPSSGRTHPGKGIQHDNLAPKDMQDLFERFTAFAQAQEG